MLAILRGADHPRRKVWRLHPSLAVGSSGAFRAFCVQWAFDGSHTASYLMGSGAGGGVGGAVSGSMGGSMGGSMDGSGGSGVGQSAKKDPKQAGTITIGLTVLVALA